MILKHVLLVVNAYLFQIILFVQTDNAKIPLLICYDDSGMSRAVNQGATKVPEAGYPLTMSVMVPWGWYIDVMELQRQYRCGHIAGASRVPPLVDPPVYFFHRGRHPPFVYAPCWH